MKKTVIEILNKAGIRDVGFCAFSEVSEALLECRAKARLPQSAQTVICCTFPYKVREQKAAFISRYAAVPDYHPICRAYLDRAADTLREKFPQNRFEVFIDNSPIPEVFAAAGAGLGVRGKNGLLITPQYGSFVFIGEIVTDLRIESVNKFSECMGCGKCLEACPKGETGECLSAVTQKKGELSPKEAESLRRHGLLWGCDICAEICPLNKGAKCTYIPEFLSGYRNTYTENEDITGRAYAWRGEKCIKRNYENMK